jgi:hypothetical protein
MTPLKLFTYLCAFGGGLLVIGLCLFVLLLLFAGVLGWSKRPMRQLSEETN